MHGRSHELTAVLTGMEPFDRLSNKFPSLTGPAGVDSDEIVSAPLCGPYTYFDQVCLTDVTDVKLAHSGLQYLLSTETRGKQIPSWHCLQPKHGSLQDCIMLSYQLLAFPTSSENPKTLQSLHVAAGPLSPFALFKVVALSLPLWLPLSIIDMAPDEM